MCKELTQERNEGRLEGLKDGLNKGRKEGIRNMLEGFLEEVFSPKRAIASVMRKYRISEDKATEYYNEVVSW